MKNGMHYWMEKEARWVIRQKVKRGQEEQESERKKKRHEKEKREE